jgi:hypothetical protein
MRHVEAISAAEWPAVKQQLQRFLGLVNFYRRFIPAAANTLAPLTDALKGKASQKSALLWTAAMQAAFEAAKKAVCDAVCLAHPDQDSPVSLAVDASGTHVGAVLQQWAAVEESWRPLSFFSKKLDAAQTKYSAFDRELLAAYLSVRHFRFLLEGRPFTLYTDHKPLVGSLSRTTEPWSARQQRHLSYLAEFAATIEHVSGVDNVVADALSRPNTVRRLREPRRQPLRSQVWIIQRWRPYSGHVRPARNWLSRHR